MRETHDLVRFGLGDLMVSKHDHGRRSILGLHVLNPFKLILGNTCLIAITLVRGCIADADAVFAANTPHSRSRLSLSQNQFKSSRDEGGLFHEEITFESGTTTTFAELT